MIEEEKDRFVAEMAKIVLAGVSAMFFILTDAMALGVGVVTFCAVFRGLVS